MSDAQTSQTPSVGQALILLYMLVGINLLFSRLKDYSCDTQALFLSSVWVRHIYTFIGVFFLLVLFTRTQPLVHPVALLGVALLICLVFLVMMRCDHRFLVAAVIALTGVFFLEAWIAYDRKRLVDGDAGQPQEQKAVANRVQGMVHAQHALQAAFAILIAAGCLVYIGQHAREYRDSWSWKTFWLGTADNKCKHDGSGMPHTLMRDARDGARRIFKGRGSRSRAQKR